MASASVAVSAFRWVAITGLLHASIVWSHHMLGVAGLALHLFGRHLQESQWGHLNHAVATATEMETTEITSAMVALLLAPCAA